MSKKLRSPKIEYWQSNINKEWYFRIKSPNGKTVNPSEGYTRKVSLLKTIDFYRRWGLIFTAVRVDPETGKVIKDGK
jgi:uncharacterized protein YegP (UPF0339 family)